LQQITGLPEKPTHFDSTDALAVAVCHHYSSRIPGLKMVSKPLAKKKTKASWEQFVAANGHRVTP
jgi:crossover junction endodeoxyribonuclease RuvC